MVQQWLNLRNDASGNTTADVFLMDVIDNWFGIGKTQFINEIRQSGAKQLNVHISSPGGSVDDALAMHDYLKGFHGQVTAKLSGVVASAATIVALGAQTVEMSDNALFMIHNISGGVWGTAEQMRQAAELIDTFEGRILNIYQRKVNANGKNMKKSQLQAMLDNETWMTAEEALAQGFIDKIAKDGLQMAALADGSRLQNMGYKNVPGHLFANNSKQSPSNKTDMKEEFESLKNFISELFKGFSKPENKKDERPEVRVLDAPEVQARLAGLENSIAQAIQARETAEAELAALKNSIGLKDTELLALRAENDRLKAGGLKDQAPNGDPDRALTAEEQEWQSLGSELRSSLSPGERALIGQNAARRNTRQ